MPYKDMDKEKEYRHRRWEKSKNDPGYQEKRREYYLSHKELFREANRKYAERHKEKIRERSHRHYYEHNDYYIMYRKEHREKNSQYLKEWRKKNIERVKDTNKKYRFEHKEELKEYKKQRNDKLWGRATFKLNYAKSKGRIKEEPCEVCGRTPAQAHHDDYNKPLSVRWLCSKHHSEWHAQNTPIYIKGES